MLKIEIADTPDLLSKGLMFRKSLDKNNGMLFKFPMTIEASFWGKNTYIPLDVAFVDNNYKISSIGSIVPLSTRYIRSDFPCIMAIEANAGFFEKNNIKVGDKIDLIKDQQGKEVEIKFLNVKNNK